MAVLAVLMSATPVGAQEPKRLEPVVVTATKIETPQERLGAAVDVITEDDLKTHNYETVGDALRQVPGVEIQRSGSLGKLTDLRIRGSSTSQVQVLVDGMRVKSPTAGSFDLSDLSIDQIERIEIIRGPQSTIHGADAIGGVVHIITKRGQGPFSATASSEVGNYDTLRERFGLGGSYKVFDYAVSGSWLESNGQFRNDGSEQRALTGRVGLGLPAEGHVGLSVRYNRNATDLPVSFTIPTSPFFVRDPDTKQQSETLTLAFVWDQKPFDWLELHARLGQFWNQLGFQNRFTPGDIAAGNFDAFDTDAQINTRRRELELVTAFHAGQWNTLTVGAEHRVEFGRNRTIGVFTEGDRQVFSKELDATSVFAQDELRLFDRLILSGGRRDDDTSAFGRATTHRVGAVVLVKETGTRVRGTWGEGFRAPTINDLFFPGFSNPSLKPERSESWDAGVEQKLWKNRVRLGVTYFENKFSGLIQFDPITNRPENVAKARTDGVEFTSALDVLDNLFFTANYTFTDSKNLTTGGPLRRVAPHRYNFGITWEPIRPLSLFTQVNVVSGQFEQEGFPRNPGYHRIDIGGTYRLAEKKGTFPGLDLTARVSNATDARIFEVFGFRALGINALVGLQARY
jgi:vitamin B12 transporter